MGACATKLTVDDGKAPAPVTEEKVVADGKEDSIAKTTKEIVEFEEEEKKDEVAVSRRKSLSNLFDEVEEERDIAKGDKEEAELSEKGLKSESINAEKNVEKVSESCELLEHNQPSNMEKHVPTEAGTFISCKSETLEAEVTKLPTPQIVTLETLKLSECDTEGTAAAPESNSTETPKPSECTNTKETAPVEPKSKTLKPPEVTKTEEVAASVAPKSETPETADASKELDTAVPPSSSETNPFEPLKTNDVPAEKEINVQVK